MRLWTLHPKYLDAKGLVALWREALLAQKVLKGETLGYRNHPQLLRFKQQEDAVAAIAGYLHAVHEEAVQRGYRFDQGKIAPGKLTLTIPVTRGQLAYEWKHLKAKLRVRDSRKYRQILRTIDPDAHPLFKIMEGNVESWEIVRRGA
jgi:hypothetical protein